MQTLTWFLHAFAIQSSSLWQRLGHIQENRWWWCGIHLASSRDFTLGAKVATYTKIGLPERARPTQEDPPSKFKNRLRRFAFLHAISLKEFTTWLWPILTCFLRFSWENWFVKRTEATNMQHKNRSIISVNLQNILSSLSRRGAARIYNYSISYIFSMIWESPHTCHGKTTMGIGAEFGPSFFL